jgi:two-component system CheB/CheR fusion protein
VAVFLDIDREKRAQETNLMLIAELRHRTRNLLAVVEAVAAEGLASSRSLSDFAETFRSRLSALSRVQAYLSGHGGGLVTIGELVRAELLALGAEHDGERVVVDGPSLVLPGQSVQILALALHELATNARKYGALSAPDGRLSVTWRMTEDVGEPRLLLNWHETGVVVDQAAVSRKGFGRKLIEESLPYQLDARTHLEFGADEVRCAIILDPGNDGHRHE